MQYSMPETSPKLADLFSLKGKNVLVIGGAGLLGGQITHALAEIGANIIVASRSIEKCNLFSDRLRESINDISIDTATIDVTNKGSIRSCFEDISNKFDGRLDVLVNCGWSGQKNTFESISDEDWDADIEVCLNGVFRCIKAAVPMLKSNRGVILNIASMYGHVAPDYRIYDGDKFSNPPSYGAAKAAIIQLTKYLASFLSEHSIRVNCISPGPFPFEETQKENPEFITRLGKKNPLGRIGYPHELKGVAALLCSDASSYMTGQNICVDGGWSVW